jgi:hypothetical protein
MALRGRASPSVAWPSEAVRPPLASIDFTPNGVELKAERRKPSGEKHCDIEDIPSLTGVLAHFRLHSFNAIRIYASGAQTPSYHPSNDPPSPP